MPRPRIFPRWFTRARRSGRPSEINPPQFIPQHFLMLSFRFAPALFTRQVIGYLVISSEFDLSDRNSIEGGQSMPHVITEPCIGCKDAACVEACPVDCIHPRRDEPASLRSGTEQLFIDPDNCIGCGMCVDECPVKAIFPEDEVPPEWNHFIQLNADHFQKNVGVTENHMPSPFHKSTHGAAFSKLPPTSNSQLPPIYAASSTGSHWLFSKNTFNASRHTGSIAVRTFFTSTSITSSPVRSSR